MRLAPPLLAALLVASCATDEPGMPSDLEDLRVELPEAPDPTRGALFEVPYMEVPPGAEVVYCLYGTYTGPTTGVNSMVPVHPSPYHHHGLLKEAYDEDPADGTLLDCTDVEQQWPPRPTLFVRVGGTADRADWLDLPEGVAFKLEQGQRWMADIHYVNTSDHPIAVNYGFLMGFIPLDEVRAVAGTFNMDAGGFEIPPGESGSMEFACPWEAEVTVLSLGGHMHAHGTEYTVDHMSLGSPPETVYEVADWNGSYRFSPPTSTFDDGALVVGPGDAFNTTCRWFNDTANPLLYPEEMCTTFGVGYPLENNYYCDDGRIVGGGDATIRGVLRREVEPSGDGIGNVSIFITDSEPIPGIPPGKGQLFELDDVDLSSASAEVPFLLRAFRPNDNPLYVVAFLDDDASGLRGGSTPGDLLALEEGWIIDGDGEFQYDLVFDLVMPDDP